MFCSINNLHGHYVCLSVNDTLTKTKYSSEAIVNNILEYNK